MYMPTIGKAIPLYSRPSTAQIRNAWLRDQVLQAQNRTQHWRRGTRGGIGWNYLI